MSTEIISKYKELEAKKLLAVVNKRGIEVTIEEAYPTKDKEINIDLLADELGISSIEGKNKIAQDNDYMVIGNYKVLFTNDTYGTPLNNWRAKEHEDFNNQPKAVCYINIDRPLNAGSKFRLKGANVEYRIKRQLTDRGITKLTKYEVVRI
jgi:hypothetical protein